ncbi:hypothetical protein, partial [Serratia proteamaculans]|uniref:hypothetical protein n=1 Tax=Serratia proteamaculans TaxID=28151 RepID=UPI0021BDBB83
VGFPIGDFERLFCHGVPLQGQRCGDLILIAAKSSIYSTKPLPVYNAREQIHPPAFLMIKAHSLHVTVWVPS